MRSSKEHAVTDGPGVGDTVADLPNDVTVWIAASDEEDLVTELLAASRRALGDEPSSRYLLGVLTEADTDLGDDRTHRVAFLGAFDGVPCGVALLHANRAESATPQARTLQMTWLYVEPEFRRSGVAEALLGAAVAWVERTGGGTLDIAAAPGDRAMKIVLEAGGFVARAIVMSRRILPRATTG